MNPARTAGAVLALACASSGMVMADGLLPTQPYHYLHPSPALARGNHAPSSIARSFPLKKGSLATDFVLFTHDSQAGMGANSGDLQARAPAASISLSIHAVNPPGQLPKNMVLDGNAYNFAFGAHPGNGTVLFRRSLSLALRWPHGPSAVLVYSAKKWREVCGPNHWQISPPNIVVCQVKSAGTYAVVRRLIR